MKTDENYLNQLTPFKYSIVLFLFTPIVALSLFFTSLFVVLCWPLVPILGFFQRKINLQEILSKRPSVTNLLKQEVISD